MPWKHQNTRLSHAGREYKRTYRLVLSNTGVGYMQEGRRGERQYCSTQRNAMRKATKREDVLHVSRAITTHTNEIRRTESALIPTSAARQQAGLCCPFYAVDAVCRRR